ncbi:leucine-rich repeat-containing protein 70 [Uranotaenia lowii]|uniref:leucine-rich repeat-containing protein 70 n=1 Tax=Uranotaenia lowii TaxID=190385 RepID=UPI002479D815|nr:leucine-rich repeat-containing protein 70 [Uranotaenia lowii]
MKILRNVLILVVCLGLVLAADEKQNSNDKKENASTEKPTEAPAKDDKKEPNALCSSCTCDAAKRTFNCSSMKLYKLFNMTEWSTLNSSGVATEIMLLVHNGISEIPVLPKFDVKVLDLSHNNISAIAKRAFIELDKLESLDLSYNLLTAKALKPEIFEGKFSSDEYEPMLAMKTLRLAYNQLHVLDSDLFEHFPNLETLSLEGNIFKVIDHQTEIALSSIHTLKSLDLSYMELLQLPEFIFKAPQDLAYLNLTGNLLTTVPEALRFTEKLKWLSLDENPLQDIDGQNVFPTIRTLEYLSMSYIHPLRVIGRGAFSKLENLKELHLCNNAQLTYLHGEAFSRPDADNPDRKDWPRLKQLYLHNNNLSVLESQLLARWDDMNLIDLRNNPWNCDCENQWIIEALLPIVEKATPAALNNIVCASPKQMAGQSMVDLERKHSVLRCKDKYGNNPANDGALLIGLLIGILAGIPLTAATILIYKRGCFGWGRRSPADYSRAFYSRTTNGDDF